SSHEKNPQGVSSSQSRRLAPQFRPAHYPRLHAHPMQDTPYAKVHAELQAKFNAMMGFGLTMLALSLACAVKNIFSTECMRAPNSWYDRK
ncbi:hypothetical protein PENTCL1PPCAC_27183, partial [Pristionchus entomophagus]